jgi:hypothetical protein
VFWRQICQAGSTEWQEKLTEKLIEKVWEYAFLNNTVIFAHAFPLLIDLVHPPPSPFSFTTQC